MQPAGRLTNVDAPAVDPPAPLAAGTVEPDPGPDAEAVAQAGVGPAPEAAFGTFRLGHRPALDGLRGLAVLVVVVYHVGALLFPTARPWLLPGGFLGVDLFFALSGFLITTLLLTELGERGRIDLRAFMRRRALRLVPALVGLFAALGAVALSGRLYAVGPLARTAAWSLTFSVNWAIVLHRPVAIGHLWSLAIEAQFYVLWSLTLVAVGLWLVPRRALRTLVALATAGVLAVVAYRAVALAAGQSTFFLYVGTLSRLDAPLVGALAGLAAASGRLSGGRARWVGRAGAGGLAGLLAATAVVQHTDRVLYQGLYTVLAVCAAAAVLGVVLDSDGRLARLLGWRPLAALGTVSYSLYLWHLPIFESLLHRTPGWQGGVRALVGVALSVGVAWASYRYVERPFLRRKRRAQPLAAGVAPASLTPAPAPAGR